ncbi:unnamed protein product [Trichobilharzia szidati]|nr:unnamed protein product [Trichobilharzia szidati]
MTFLSHDITTNQNPMMMKRKAENLERQTKSQDKWMDFAEKNIGGWIRVVAKCDCSCVCYGKLASISPSRKFFAMRKVMVFDPLSFDERGICEVNPEKLYELVKSGKDIEQSRSVRRRSLCLHGEDCSCLLSEATTQSVRKSRRLEGKKSTPRCVPGHVVISFTELVTMETLPIRLSQQPKGVQKPNRIALTRQASEVKRGGDSDEVLRSAKTPTSKLRKNSQCTNERSMHDGRKRVKRENNPETNLNERTTTQPGDTWNIGIGEAGRSRTHMRNNGSLLPKSCNII